MSGTLAILAKNAPAILGAVAPMFSKEKRKGALNKVKASAAVSGVVAAGIGGLTSMDPEFALRATVALLMTDIGVPARYIVPGSSLAASVISTVSFGLVGWVGSWVAGYGTAETRETVGRIRTD